MKKLIALLLSCSMVFTMSVSAFAETSSANANWPQGTHLAYMAIGDSIGAGFLSVRDADITKKYAGEPEYTRHGIMEPNDYSPEFNRPYCVSYANILYNYIGYNANSYNMTYPGFRAEDIANILGVMSTDPIYNKATAYRAVIEDHIKKADIITFQLGFNDILKQLSGNVEEIIASVLISAKSVEGLIDIPAKIDDIRKTEDVLEKAWKILALVVEINANLIGTGAAPITLDKYISKGATTAIEATDKTVEKIHQLNPDAVVVVVYMNNPLATIGDTMVELNLISSKIGARALNNAGALIASAYMNIINSSYASIADKYGYVTADASLLAPHKKGLFHLDAVAQARLADIIKNALERANTGRKNEREDGITGVQSSAGRYDRCSCGGDEYITQYTVAPTYLSAGKAQDYCAVCKNKLGKEYVAARFNLAKVKNVTVKSGSKRATVKYGAVKGATGYQIYCKQSGKSAKKYKTTALSKTIKNLKSGKKYTFKVRAYVTGNGKTYYGNWSKTLRGRS